MNGDQRDPLDPGPNRFDLNIVSEPRRVGKATRNNRRKSSMNGDQRDPLDPGTVIAGLFLIVCITAIAVIVAGGIIAAVWTALT